MSFSAILLSTETRIVRLEGKNKATSQGLRQLKLAAESALIREVVFTALIESAKMRAAFRIGRQL